MFCVAFVEPDRMRATCRESLIGRPWSDVLPVVGKLKSCGRRGGGRDALEFDQRSTPRSSSPWLRLSTPSSLVLRFRTLAFV